MPNHDFFRRLSTAGTWSWSRKLSNPKQQKLIGTAQGKATFTTIDENTLYYEEQGELHFPDGSKHSVKSEYIYTYQEGEVIKKYNSKGGKKTDLMFTLQFQEAKLNYHATGSYLCKKDTYIAKFCFFNGEKFSKFKLTYTVNGPAKDYISETYYKNQIFSFVCV